MYRFFSKRSGLKIGKTGFYSSTNNIIELSYCQPTIVMGAMLGKVFQGGPNIGLPDKVWIQSIEVPKYWSDNSFYEVLSSPVNVKGIIFVLQHTSCNCMIDDLKIS